MTDCLTKRYPRETLNGEILIYFADKNFIRKLNNIVVGVVRNSTAIGDGS